jgi:glycosyltransferase involved in cell wall biosynthesis
MEACMRVSVVVPARNAEATLARCLAAIAAQEAGEPFEVLVVDDGSSDGTVAVAKRAAGEVRVIEQEALGPAAARNRGAGEARGDVLAFTDADCFPAPGWLAAGLLALEAADLVQGAVEPDPSVRPLPLDRTIAVRRETALFESANLLVRRELFERLGGFEQWIEPEIGKSFGEDLWLGWRARRAGARVAFAPDALVHHAVLRRDLRQYVEDHRRLRYFPAACALVPELRDAFLFRRVFLSRRTAAFDAAALAVLAAAATRSRAPLAAALPYAAELAREARGWRTRVPEVVTAAFVRDAVGLASLVRGSVTYRAPVL